MIPSSRKNLHFCYFIRLETNWRSSAHRPSAVSSRRATKGSGEKFFPVLKFFLLILAQDASMYECVEHGREKWHFPRPHREGKVESCRGVGVSHTHSLSIRHARAFHEIFTIFPDCAFFCFFSAFGGEVFTPPTQQVSLSPSPRAGHSSGAVDEFLHATIKSNYSFPLP
jgi:hypothetical protein